MHNTRYDNNAFYTSPKWRRVSAAYMSSRGYICERCGAPAVICHHRQHLNDVNVHDPAVALDFANLEALCQECHNAEHGSRHDVAIFNDAGDMVGVKESVGTKAYRASTAELDDVLARAKALLSVVSCGDRRGGVAPGCGAPVEEEHDQEPEAP